MIIKNLSLETLDQVVAVALRRDNFNLYKELYLESPEWNPTKRWDQGGPIIEYASIALDSPATPGDVGVVCNLRHKAKAFCRRYCSRGGDAGVCSQHIRGNGATRGAGLK